MRLTLLLLVIATLLSALAQVPATALDNTEYHQEKTEQRVDKTEQRLRELDNRISQLESALENKAGIGGVLFLIGIFCALWAQNTGRSAWLWFFLGVVFSVITVIVLLVKNANYIKLHRHQHSLPNHEI